MDDEARRTPQPICAQEALDLLNCATESPFDQDKCLRLLHSLRLCVQTKLYRNTHRIEGYQENFEILKRAMASLAPRAPHLASSLAFQKVKKFTLAEQSKGQGDSKSKKDG